MEGSMVSFGCDRKVSKMQGHDFGEKCLKSKFQSDVWRYLHHQRSRTKENEDNTTV